MMSKVAEYNISRAKAAVYAVIIGLFIGLVNLAWRPIDFTLNLKFLGWAGIAMIAVIFLHEGVHGLAAVLFRQKPRFELKPPLVYITFTDKIPRGYFILIALAPLVILDIAFGIIFTLGVLDIFSYFCLIINTIGATGDIWIIIKLLPHKRGILVQDTKTGIEIWQAV